MKKRLIGTMTVALLGIASGLQAQSWDTPSFLGPRPVGDVGVYLIDGDYGDFGVHGIWRQTGPANLGIRLGLVDEPAPGDDLGVQFGAETWGTIVLADQDFPFDVSWTAGAGVSVNGGTTVSVPAGVSIGGTFDVGSIAMQAYLHPRLALVAFENPAPDDDDLELELEGLVDLGADMYLSDRWTLRIAASFGDPDGLGIGLAWH